MTEIKAVLFDLDDTLFDHRHAAASTLRLIRQGHPALCTVDADRLEHEYHRLVEDTWESVLAGRLTVHEARIERFVRLFELCGETLSEADADRVALSYRDGYQTNRQPVEGALELLAELHGRARIGIVTNNFVQEQQEKLDHCGLSRYIDFLVTSEEVGVPKPGAEMFLRALQRARCAPEEAVMLGDSWQNDVLGALAAGMRAVWLNRLGLPRPEGLGVPELRSLLPTSDALAALLDGRPASREALDAR